MCGPRAEARLSLWVAILGAETLNLVTDSAMSAGSFAISAQKIWRYGRRDWVAAACSFRNLEVPPAVWPSPDVDQPFKESAHALTVQMRSGELTTSPVYALALIRASNDGLELARVSHEGTVFAAPGSVFAGGFAERLPAEFIPSGDVWLGGAAIAMAVRTLRLYGHEKTSGGALAIAWPLSAYVWRRGGTLSGARIDQAEGTRIEAEMAELPHNAA